MSRSRLVAAASVVAVVLVAAGLLLTLLAQRWLGDGAAAAAARPGTGLGADAQQVLGVARQDAVDFTTYDYRHLQADFDRFTQQTTGALRTQYRAQTQGLAAVFRKAKVQSVGQVVTAGIGQDSADQVTVLVAVNDTIHSTNYPSGRVVYDRLAFVLKRVGGQWLAAEVHTI